jgi:hypothetical protein
LNFIQNVFAILAFCLILFASYVGFLFAKELAVEGANSQGGMGGFSVSPINQNQRGSNLQTNAYGGANYLYENRQQNQRVNTLRNGNERAAQSFQPFQGESYSLN